MKLRNLWLPPIWACSFALLGAEPEQPPQAAQQQVLTGRELLDACTADPNPESELYQFCMTFMVGLVQTVSVLQQSGEAPALFCVDPNQVTPEAVRDEALSWMKRHERRMQEEAYILVSEALHAAYPCPESPGTPASPGPAPDNGTQTL